MGKRKGKLVYKEWVYGVFGQFGSGANARIMYIQSAFKPNNLDKITLVGDIKGSERWGIRDLFQREVDNTRVTDGLLPYFEDESKVKFFNPITLTVLPIHRAQNKILSEMPFLGKKKIVIDEENWVVYEKENYFRIMHHQDDFTYGKFEWNPDNVEIVAIDGQHRLSALKRFKDDVVGKEKLYEDYMQWSIPAVIFGLTKLEENAESSTLLDIIRNIFIYINKTAKPPNLARQILLSDESINSICTQELLQNSHENDIKEIDSRDRNRLPLWFFDWRGEEKGGKRIYSPASVKSTEEIYYWFVNYLLGDDFSGDQGKALGISTMHDLHSVFVNDKIDQRDTEKIRRQCNETVLQGVEYLLQYFKPYKDYVERIRAIENNYEKKSDISRHAFYRLRFGDHVGDDSIKSDIADEYEELINEISGKKKDLPSLIEKEIGMRGVISSFAALKNEYERLVERKITWLNYAEWFTVQLNRLVDLKWFDDTSVKIKNLLLHVTADHQSIICNYKFKDAKNALGRVLSILIMSIGLKDIDDTAANVDEYWTDFKSVILDDIKNEVIRGYKKQMRGELREKYPLGGKPLTEAVNTTAGKKANAHIRKLEKYVESLR
jgi:hypothetical protein